MNHQTLTAAAAALGQRGGRAKSTAKSIAARRNGQQGATITALRARVAELEAEIARLMRAGDQFVPPLVSGDQMPTQVSDAARSAERRRLAAPPTGPCPHGSAPATCQHLYCRGRRR